MSDPGAQPPAPGDHPGLVPALRASDVERERAADQLRHAAGEGRLTVDELDERLTRCYAAKTVGELAELTVDVVASDRDPMPGSARTPGAVVKPGLGGSSTIISATARAVRSGPVPPTRHLHWQRPGR